MHKRILEHASSEQIKEFATDFLTMLKARDEDLYNEAECWLYKEIYGPHFSDWMLEKALSKMCNEDGTTGGHWKLSDTNEVAKAYGITFDRFNQYDWNFVLNMIYSDYYGSISDSVEAYTRLAKKFIMDKDAPEGKAFLYYKAMHI